MMDDYAAGETDRRIGNTVRIGTVSEFDPAQGVRVDLGELVTDWLPIGQRRAGKQRSWNPLDIGEQVVIAAPGGEISQGVIVCTLSQDAHPANGAKAGLWRETFDDGTQIEYDQDTGALRADVTGTGSIVLHIGGSTLTLRDGQATLTTSDVVVQSPQTTFTGKVVVQGQLTFQNGLSGSKGSGSNSVSGGLVLNGINMETHGHIEQGDGNRVGNPVA